MYPRSDLHELERSAKMRKRAPRHDRPHRPGADDDTGRRVVIAITVLLGLAALFGGAEMLLH